jgi:ABC-type multidrug transport system ATPase subunit
LFGFYLNLNVAQMGSSGAGKTTLLDVLSGRKNTGETAGGMFVNGHQRNRETFKNVMGYVEQFDTLSPRDTVREAVEFSATLRLPRETPAEMRAQWVTTVLSMLELLPLENTMIGNEEVRGLSYEQKKRVSIAVELAANPAILFLDEPTTGLDSRAAQVVIRCIKRVAASGRTIVCTIHQPSAVIFEAFDSLLLLRRGGQTVYFGELGENFSHLVNYLEAIPGVGARSQGSNPATWMLEVIGAGTSGASANVIDFHAYYLNSAQCTVNTQRVNALTSAAISPDDIESGNVVVVKSAECGFVPVFFGNGPSTDVPLSAGVLAVAHVQLRAHGGERGDRADLRLHLRRPEVHLRRGRYLPRGGDLRDAFLYGHCGHEVGAARDPGRAPGLLPRDVRKDVRHQALRTGQHIGGGMCAMLVLSLNA